MGALMTVVVVLSLTATINASCSSTQTTQEFLRHEALDADENYCLFWDFNDTDITFEVHVKTKGYVGFGISQNGKMFPADVVVGWVEDDGTPHLKDRHTTGQAAPEVYPQQDWTLLHAVEEDTITVLKFVRKIKTCDTMYGEDIKDGTTRIIYAYSENDPASDDDLMYHGPDTRGTNSIPFLKTLPTTQMPDDVIRSDFLNRNVLVPSDTTTYMCSAFQFPDIGKHHILKYEPVITPGNEMMVHHLVLLYCKDVDPIMDGMQYECSHNKINSCYNAIIARTMGGKGDSFVIECKYDSTERTEATFGGLSTTDEMCLSWVMYYPKTSLEGCYSSSTFDAFSLDEGKVYNALHSVN